MPRLARNLLGSLFVHAMCQGINKEYIFQKDIYKQKYLKLIYKYREKFNITVISYCIMDNHTHLLIYAEKIQDISNFMKEVNSKYALYYNKINDRVGYVFRNRFNSKPIYSEEQLLKCIKYIHMNPVKAGLVKEEKEYKFSSYMDYINNSGLINSKSLKLVFGTDSSYMHQFLSIKDEVFEQDEEINLDEQLKIFLYQHKINLIDLKNNKNLIKKFMCQLISQNYKFTKTQIAKLLQISRGNLYRKIK